MSLMDYLLSKAMYMALVVKNVIGIKPALVFAIIYFLLLYLIFLYKKKGSSFRYVSVLIVFTAGLFFSYIITLEYSLYNYW
jgi:uncharacterized membrane protein